MDIKFIYLRAKYGLLLVVGLEDFKRAPKDMEAHLEKLKIERRDKTPCFYCGGKSTSFDHFIAASLGGRANKENLLPCCGPCNQRKANHYPNAEQISKFKKLFVIPPTVDKLANQIRLSSNRKSKRRLDFVELYEKTL